MDRYRLNSDGKLSLENKIITLSEVEDTKINILHLTPHIIQFDMPRGDIIKAKVIYSSHCWSKKFDPNIHDSSLMKILDNRQARIFCNTRYEQSKKLPNLISNLHRHRLYLTSSKRNYGAYNATMIFNGLSYTAFFTIKKERGRLNKIRYSLLIYVESAYNAEQPCKGSKVKIYAAINSALRGKKLRYR